MIDVWISGKLSSIMFDKEKKKKNEHIQRKHMVVFVSAIVFISVGLFLCVRTTFIDIRTLGEQGVHELSVFEKARIQENLGNAFLPDSATNIYGYYRGNYSFRMRFDLLATDAPTFWDSIVYCRADFPLEPNVTVFTDDEEDPLWQPQTVEKYMGTTCSENLDILIDQTSDDIWTIYVGKGTGRFLESAVSPIDQTQEKS
jgi:hypothetical protein